MRRWCKALGRVALYAALASSLLATLYSVYWHYFLGRMVQWDGIGFLTIAAAAWNILALFLLGYNGVLLNTSAHLRATLFQREQQIKQMERELGRVRPTEASPYRRT